MSSALHTFRYSAGVTEFAMSEQIPQEGDILRKNGDNWVVEHVREADDGTAVVTLRPQPLLAPESEDE